MEEVDDNDPPYERTDGICGRHDFTIQAEAPAVTYPGKSNTENPNSGTTRHSDPSPGTDDQVRLEPIHLSSRSTPVKTSRAGARLVDYGRHMSPRASGNDSERAESR